MKKCFITKISIIALVIVLTIQVFNGNQLTGSNITPLTISAKEIDEGKDEIKIYVSNEVSTKIHNVINQYFELYYQSFVSLKASNMSSNVVLNDNTFLYKTLLETDIDNSITLGTGYSSYLLDLNTIEFKSVSENNCTVKTLHDLKYNYAISPEINSALYNVRYDFNLEKINGTWMITKISSTFDEFDEFKEEVAENFDTKENLNSKNFKKAVSETSVEFKNNAKSFKKTRKDQYTKLDSKMLNCDPVLYTDNRYHTDESKKGKNLFSMCIDVIGSGLSKLDNAQVASAASTYSYSYSKGVAYASAYAESSTSSRLFYTTGSDCTNFVSQCVWAAYGGYVNGDLSKTKGNIRNKVRMTSTWFAGTGGGASNWESVSSFYNYTTSSKSTGPEGTGYNNNKFASSLTSIQIGDVIQVKRSGSATYGHSVYVTAATYNVGSGTVYYVSQHSSNKLNRSYNDLISSWGGSSCYARRISFSSAVFSK